jgi:23S rRNA pseudouridine2605 synthase
VTVNGQVVTELGVKVDPDRDEIRVDGRRIEITPKNMYVMIHKPRGILTTMVDKRGRKALGDLIETPERLYPVGRLDVNSEGLVLLTDDGELTNYLTHPRYQHDKEYIVLVNGHPSEETLAAWRRGVMLEGEPTAPAEVDLIRKERDSARLRIVLRQGRKRQIREVAALLGHPVRELKRVRLGPLELGSLASGQWRYLTAKEIRELEHIKRTLRQQEKKRRRRRRR